MSMWQPFTERARRAIVLAQERAQVYGSRSIEPDHIFIGIIEEGGSAAAEAAASFGISAQDVRAAADKRMKIGDVIKGEMIFSSSAKRVIELAFEESRKLQHNYLGTEHLMLGYLGETNAESSILAALHVDAAKLRTKVVEFLEKEPKATAPRHEAPTEAGADSLELLFADISSLDSPGLKSAIERESERRLYYIDSEELWKRLQGAVARRDVTGSLMYAFFIDRRENRTAAETLHEIRRRMNQNYGN